MNAPTLLADCDTDTMDDVLELIDAVERQVEDLRTKAIELDLEKTNLLKTISSVGADITAQKDDEASLSEIDREEVKVNLERLTRRLEAVQINVATSRDEHQVHFKLPDIHFSQNLYLQFVPSTISSFILWKNSMILTGDTNLPFFRLMPCVR